VTLVNLVEANMIPAVLYREYFRNLRQYKEILRLNNIKLKWTIFKVKKTEFFSIKRIAVYSAGLESNLAQLNHIMKAKGTFKLIFFLLNYIVLMLIIMLMLIRFLIVILV